MSRRIQVQSKGRNAPEESREEKLEQNIFQDAAIATQTAPAGAPVTPPQSEPMTTSQETQQFLQGFVQQIMQQQDLFMQQMAERQEQHNLEIIREQENMRKEWRQQQMQHQRLMSERITPPRETLNSRMAEDTPASELNLRIDEVNPRNVNRRDSAVQRLTTFNGLTSREGILTLESDKHASITWENRSIDGFLKFLDEIDKFTLTYNQPVPYLFTHINENLQEIIAELLYVNKPQKYTTMIDIFKATTADIVEMVQIYFAPRDLAHFNTLLSNACKKYEVFQKGDFYAPTRLKLYGLRKKFKERYDFLVAGADKTSRKDCIPAINYKQGGLLNIWTDLTPEGSRESFKQMLVNGKYDTLDAFLEKYFAKVDETNNLSENIKVYKYRIGTNYEKSQETDSHQRKGERLYNMEKGEDVKDKDDVVDEEDAEVFAMGDNVKVEYTQEACPKLMLKGQCWQRDCKFSHKSALINSEKNKLIQQWSKQQDQRRPPTQVQQQRVQHKNEDKKQQLAKDPTAVNWKRNLTPPAWQKSSNAETHRRVPVATSLS